MFYNTSTAASGVFHNLGGTAYGQLSVIQDGKVIPKETEQDGTQVPAEQGANGGDVAFDSSATGGHGHFHNDTVLSASNLSDHSLAQFKDNNVDGAEPKFEFQGEKLVVSFSP